MQQTQSPIVLFRIDKGLYGVDSINVVELIKLPAVTQVPDLPYFVRGVMNSRNHVIPLIDIRILFGKEPRCREAKGLIELLTQREQDHINWLNTLESAIREDREFTLATDPHECAFGKWYDTFHTDHVALSSVLQQFDAPHQRIHALADTLMAITQEGRRDDALRQLQVARNGDLRSLITLFEKARNIVRSCLNETAVVMELGGNRFGMIVDAVESVTQLSDECKPMPDISKSAANAYCSHFFQYPATEELGLFLHTEMIAGLHTGGGVC